MRGTTDRRGLLRLALGLAAGAAGTGVAGTAEAAIGKALLFGDSYTMLGRAGFPNWAEQLRARGVVNGIESYAKSGATAADIGSNTFARQIRLWQQANRGLRPGNVVVVYFGYNDIIQFSSNTASRAGYRAGIDALVRGGATSNGVRLFLVQPHDVGSMPRFNSSSSSRATFRSRTIAWNSYIASVQQSVRGSAVINVARDIDAVLANPSREGLTNVRTPDRARSATTALYFDDIHFGQKGHSLIARTVQRSFG
jgi:lysophospholipase L1-like esterase